MFTWKRLSMSPDDKGVIVVSYHMVVCLAVICVGLPCSFGSIGYEIFLVLYPMLQKKTFL